MESQPQNPEFRTNPETFTHADHTKTVQPQLTLIMLDSWVKIQNFKNPEL